MCIRDRYNGGCSNNPDICFVFMNPTKRNIASSKEWKGIKSPWIGTKNIWDLFYNLDLLDKDIYNKIKNIKGTDWTKEFAEEVYSDAVSYTHLDVYKRQVTRYILLCCITIRKK